MREEFRLEVDCNVIVRIDGTKTSELEAGRDIVVSCCQGAPSFLGAWKLQSLDTALTACIPFVLTLAGSFLVYTMLLGFAGCVRTSREECNNSTYVVGSLCIPADELYSRTEDATILHTCLRGSCSQYFLQQPSVSANR